MHVHVLKAEYMAWSGDGAICSCCLNYNVSLCSCVVFQELVMFCVFLRNSPGVNSNKIQNLFKKCESLHQSTFFPFRCSNRLPSIRKVANSPTSNQSGAHFNKRLPRSNGIEYSSEQIYVPDANLLEEFTHNFVRLVTKNTKLTFSSFQTLDVRLNQLNWLCVVQIPKIQIDPAMA